MLKPASIQELAMCSYPELVSRLTAESGEIRRVGMQMRHLKLASLEDGVRSYQQHQAQTFNNEKAATLEAQLHENGCTETSIINFLEHISQGSSIHPKGETHYKEIRDLFGDDDHDPCERNITYRNIQNEAKEISIRCDQGLLKEIKEYVALDTPRDAVELTNMAANLLDIVSDFQVDKLSPVDIKLESEANINRGPLDRVKIYIAGDPGRPKIISINFCISGGTTSWGTLAVNKIHGGKLSIHYTTHGTSNRHSGNCIKLDYLKKGKYHIYRGANEFSEAAGLKLNNSTTETLDEFLRS